MQFCIDIYQNLQSDITIPRSRLFLLLFFIHAVPARANDPTRAVFRAGRALRREPFRNLDFNAQVEVTAAARAELRQTLAAQAQDLDLRLVRSIAISVVR